MFPQGQALIFLICIFMQKLSPLIILLPSLDLSWLQFFFLEVQIITAHSITGAITLTSIIASQTNVVWVL